MGWTKILNKKENGECASAHERIHLVAFECDDLIAVSGKFTLSLCVAVRSFFVSELIFGDFSIPSSIACFLHFACTCLSMCMYRSLSRSINLINRIHYVIKLHNCTFLSIGREREQFIGKSNETHSRFNVSENLYLFWNHVKSVSQVRNWLFLCACPNNTFTRFFLCPIRRLIFDQLQWYFSAACCSVYNLKLVGALSFRV